MSHRHFVNENLNLYLNFLLFSYYKCFVNPNAHTIYEDHAFFFSFHVSCQFIQYTVHWINAIVQSIEFSEFSIFSI